MALSCFPYTGKNNMIIGKSKEPAFLSSGGPVKYQDGYLLIGPISDSADVSVVISKRVKCSLLSASGFGYQSGEGAEVVIGLCPEYSISSEYVFSSSMSWGEYNVLEDQKKSQAAYSENEKRGFLKITVKNRFSDFGTSQIKVKIAGGI